jgi:pyruvate dehydrogenase E1 component alpha subunit
MNFRSKQDYLEAYSQMVTIRRLEEKCAEFYQQGKIGGFLHLYIGQEAVAVGISAAMSEHDHLITAYRDHGVAYTQGMEPKVIFAELLGKVTGCSKGKGGSMHLADTRLNFWGGHAIVGAQLPLGAGLALGFKYQKKPDAVVCMMGDGATNIGYFHEAVNLSKVWNLPIVWLCENNQYGMGTAVERASAVSEIRRKAEGYGITNDRCNGMNPAEVYKAVKRALKHAREEGPFFLEAMTYRFHGHSMGDPERYRDQSEIRKWREDDPIGDWRQIIIEKGFGTDAELNQMDDQILAEIAVAAQWADESPEPGMDELFADLYADDSIVISREF